MNIFEFKKEINSTFYQLPYLKFKFQYNTKDVKSKRIYVILNDLNYHFIQGKLEHFIGQWK